MSGNSEAGSGSRYRYLQHTKRFLRDARAACPLSEKALLDAGGYADPQMLGWGETDLLDLQRPVPVRFLEALGTSLEALEAAVAVDREACEAEVARGLTTRAFAVIRSLLIASQWVPFAQPMGEIEAVPIVVDYTRNHSNHRYCLLNFQCIRYIYVSQGQVDATRTFIPSIQVSRRGRVTFPPTWSHSE